MKRLWTALAFFLAAGTAHAQCPVPADPPDDGVRFFLGMQPSDGPLDVWCRLQALNGKYRLDVSFSDFANGPSDFGPHRAFDMEFSGRPERPRRELADLIQSLLPTGDGPPKDENGQAFPAVLAKTVQGTAAKTPDGQALGLPPDYPRSRELFLASPLTIRLRTLKMAGSDFTLEVYFKPSVARFMMALSGQAEDLTFAAWKGRVVQGSMIGECGSAVPDCKGLPDVLRVHAAWQFDRVIIRSDPGTRLSATAMTLLGQIAADNARFVSENTMDRFDPAVGDGRIAATDGVREVIAVSEPDGSGTAGSRGVKAMWREKPEKPKQTYAGRMAEWAAQARRSLVLAYPGR